MNTILFSIPNKTQGYIIALILFYTTFVGAQEQNMPVPNQSQVLNQKELDAINNAPIAQKVYARDRVDQKKRQPDFSYQSDAGTQIKEYADIGQNKEIQVDSSMGTHYQMAPTSNKDATSSSQTIQRVPTIQIPF
jgi:hypothetical protein